MKFILFLIVSLFSINISAQYPCGALEDTNPIRYNKNELREEINNLNDGYRAPRIFMIAFNVIRDSEGKPYLAKSNYVNALNQLNANFANSNIYFKLCGSINYIDNSKYKEVTTTTANNLSNIYNIKDAINVYFFPKYRSNSNKSLCGSSTFPSTPAKNRHIFMSNNCVNNGSTFIHEMGHYFGLPHTHTTSFGKERVARINCYSSGDGFCDTPADPKLSSTTVKSCLYTEIKTDNFGDYYTPQVKNFMSYAPKSCRYYFSDEQRSQISLVANNQNSNHLEMCSQLPDFTIVSDHSKENSIKDLSGISIKYAVKRQNQYTDDTPLVRIRMIGTNSSTIIHEEKIIFKDNEESQNKIIEIPFSTELIASNKIEISIDDDKKINELRETNNKLTFNFDFDFISKNKSIIYPNPSDSNLNIVISNTLLGTTTISIYGSNGQLVLSTQLDKFSKHLLSTIDISILPAGIYFVKIDIKDIESETLKFIKL